MEVAKNEKELFRSPTDLTQDELNNWFETFIDDLKTDHMMLTTGVAPEEKKIMYKAIIQKDALELAKTTRKMSTVIFIKSLVQDYLNELNSQKNRPIKLALGLSDSKILVWSVINDNDDETENTLLIAEAKVNGKYYKHGFYLNSTIIEESDNLATPPHYQTIIG